MMCKCSSFVDNRRNNELSLQFLSWFFIVQFITVPVIGHDVMFARARPFLFGKGMAKLTTFATRLLYACAVYDYYKQFINHPVL